MSQEPIASPAPFEWRPADTDAVAEAFRATRATPTPNDADWSGYAEGLADRFADWVGTAAAPLAGLLHPGIVTILKWVVVALAVAILAVVLVRAVETFLRPRRSVAEPQTERLPAAVDRPPMHYAEEVRRALERNDARGALTAMWWWFGASVLKATPEPAMTTHDVLARSQRFDLRRLTQTLDRLRFGAAEPRVADVRQLFTGLEGAL